MYALNRINPRKLKEISTLNTSSFVKKELFSFRELGLAAFGIDIYSELLRRISGRQISDNTKVSGSDCLWTSISSDKNQRKSQLRKLFLGFCDTDYKKDFYWVDYFSLENSSAALEDRLINSIRHKNAYFDFFGRDGVGSLQNITVKNGGADLCSLMNLYKEIPETEDLKNLSLFHKENGDFIGKLIDHIFAEVSLGDARFIFFQNKWFKIDQKYMALISSEFHRNASSGFEAISKRIKFLYYDKNNLELRARKRLGKPRKRYPLEEEYNRIITIENNGCLCDGSENLISTERGRIEFCDVMLDDKILIHTKHVSRKGGGASSVSHVCAQALNSAELFLRDPGFRKKVKKKFEKSISGANHWLRLLEPKDKLSPELYTVVIVLAISRNQTTNNLDLPDLGKNTIVKTLTRLRSLGFGAHIFLVEDATGLKPSQKQLHQAINQTLDLLKQFSNYFSKGFIGNR
jgi:uncharacterized protein (TIGR04141 family)